MHKRGAPPAPIVPGTALPDGMALPARDNDDPTVSGTAMNAAGPARPSDRPKALVDALRIAEAAVLNRIAAALAETSPDGPYGSETIARPSKAAEVALFSAWRRPTD